LCVCSLASSHAARDKPGGSASAFEAVAAAHRCLSDGHGAAEGPAISGGRGRGNLVAEGVGRHADNKSVAEGLQRGAAGAARPPRTSRWMTPGARTARRRRRGRVSGGDHHHHQRRRRERGIGVCAEGCRLRFDRGLDLPPLGQTSAEKSLEDEAERRLAPWNQPFEVCACVRVRACKRVFCKRENAYPLTPFLSYTPGRDETRNAARRPGSGGRPRGSRYEEQGGGGYTLNREGPIRIQRGVYPYSNFACLSV